MKCLGYSHLWNHFTEAGHDVCAFSFLIVSEDTSEDDNQCQDYSKVELINKRHNPVNLRQVLSSSSARINHSSVLFRETLKIEVLVRLKDSLRKELSSFALLMIK